MLLVRCPFFHPTCLPTDFVSLDRFMYHSCTSLKSESHWSDNKNDNDHDAKENAFYWLNCRIRTRSFNQWNAFSLRCYRCRSRYQSREAITKTITITTQKRTLSIGWIAEYAHAHSTNGMHSLCVAIVVVLVISLVIAAVGPGLYLLQC